MTTQKRIDQLKIGDMVDLRGDQYADPGSLCPWFEFEYAIVDYIEIETSNCTTIGFEGFDIVGFPPNHTVKVPA